MKAIFTSPLKALARTCALAFLLGFVSENVNAQAPFQGGQTYWVDGVGNDLVAPKDTFINLMGFYGGGAYQNTTGILSALNTNGTDAATAGTINIILVPGYTGVETSLIAVGNTLSGGYPGMALSRPVVLRPAAGMNVTITTSSFIAGNASLFRFNGVQFFTINGEGTSGQRNLTFDMGSSNQTTSKIIDIIPFANNGCNSITIRNCRLLGNSTTTSANTFAGVYLGSIATPGNAARRSQNISILNNVIEAVQCGIYMRGLGTTINNHDLGLNISNNVIGGVIAPGGGSNTTFIGGSNTFANAGILLSAQANAVVQGNIIRNNIPSSFSNGNFRGIALTTDAGTFSIDSGITINANRIYNLTSLQSNTGVYGIRFQNATSHANPYNISITNNVVSDIMATSGIASLLAATYNIGISLEDNSANAGITMAYNTIHMYGDTLNAGGFSAAVFIGTNVTGGITMLNNMIANRMGRTISTAGNNSVNYGVVVANATANPFALSNNNAFYLTTSRGGNAFIGFSQNRGRASLNDWRLSTTGDANSITTIPPFIGVDDTTCAISNGAGSLLGNAGAAIAGLATDINGTSRPASATSIGAYQFTPNTTQAYYPLNGGAIYRIRGNNSWPVGPAGAGEFATVSDAVNYVNHFGVAGSGNIQLVLEAGYNKNIESFIPHINDYVGASASRRVILTIANGYADTITMPAINNIPNHAAVLRFIGSDFFTVDGNNKNLTLLIPGNITNTTAKVVAITPTESSPTTDITITGCILQGSSNTFQIFTSAAIYLGHHTPPSGVFASSLFGLNNNLVFTNNNIESVRSGIFLRSLDGIGLQSRNITIARNIIGGVIAPNGTTKTTFIGGSGSTTDQAGISLKAIANCVVDSNVIRNCFPTGTSSVGFKGIDLDFIASEPNSKDSNITVSRNFIYNIITGSSFVYGIRYHYGTTDTTGVRAIRFINNSIANIRASGSAAIPTITNPGGIVMEGSAVISNLGLQLLYNTINMSGSTLNSNTGSYGVYFPNSIRGGVLMRNNNIINRLGRLSGTGNNCAVFVGHNASIFAGPTTISNNNNYVSAGANATNFIAIANNGAQTFSNLAAWQVFTGGDLQSLSNNVAFSNDTLPNPDLTLAAPLFNAAVSLPGITNDIYGNTRGGVNSCIGAVEFPLTFLPLAGGQTYLINGVQNQPRVAGTAPFSFSTISRAIQYLNANGVDNASPASPIILETAAGYMGEGDTLITTISAYPRSSASRPVVLRPGAGRNDTITTLGGGFGPYPANGSVIRFDGASNFIIDGSNNGSNTRNFTIMLPATATATTLKVVDLSSAGTPNTNITVRNCNIIGNSTTFSINSFAGIYSGGSVTTPSNAGVSGNNNNRFENNFIGAVRYGIYLRGFASTSGSQDRGNIIRRNEIGGNHATGGTAPTNYFGGINNAAGIYLGAQAVAVVDSNVIKNNISTFNNNRGIDLSSEPSTTLSLDSGISVRRNIIYDIFNTTGLGGAYGITVNLGSIPTNAQTPRNIDIINNMISGVSSGGTGAGNVASTLNPYGILVESNTQYNNVGLNLIYNSINLAFAIPGSLPSQPSSVCAPIMFNSNIRGGITLRNNLLQNSLGRTAPTGYAYALVIGANVTNMFNTIDNNSYFVNAANTINRISAFNAASNHVTANFNANLAAHMAYTNQDLYSISIASPFTNDTILFIPDNTPSTLWAGGAFVAGYNTDIRGASRDPFTPSIGAHEYLGSYLDSVAPRLFNVTPPATVCSNGPYNIVIRFIERTRVADTLFYSVNGGPEQFVLVSAVTGEFRTYTIPVQPNNSNIRYRVVCYDASGLIGSFPASGFDLIGTLFNTFPVTNGFDGAAGGWSVEQISGNGLWQLSQLGGSVANPSLAPATGIRAAVFPSATLPNGTASRIVSPCMDFSNMKNPTVRLWVSQNADLPLANDQIAITVNTGFGWSFPLVQTGRVNPNFPFPGYRQIDVCLKNFIGIPSVKVGIEATAAGAGNNVIIDSIIVFDDLQSISITPLTANICAYDNISLQISSSSSQYSYRLIDAFTALPMSAVVTGTGNALTLTAANPNTDSVFVNVQYTNLLTTNQGTSCSNSLNDTAKIYISRFTSGPFAAKGSPFTGAYNNGTSLDPDGAIVGDTLEYNIVAPSGLPYSSFGTRWTITSNQIRTAAGTNISNAVYTPPTTSGAGKYVVRPGLADGDSTFIMTINYRLLPTNCDSLVTRFIKITSPPTSLFSNGRDSVCAGSLLNFVNQSSGSPATLPLTYNWSFGDNTTSTLSEPSKSWTTPGQYVVRLETRNNSNIMRSFQKTITVLPVPVASFSNGLVCSNDSVTFTNNSTGTGLNNAWTYSLGGSIIGTSTAQNPKAFFAVVDTTYNVLLTVTNNVGCSNSTLRTVYVFPRPVASFTTANHCNGALLPITNNSNVPSAKAGNSFGSNWEFGNGGTGLSNNPTYRYPSAGSFVIKLKVTSNFGCIDSTSQPVTVFPKPAAGYTFTNACQSDSIRFSNTTTFVGGLANVSYNWNFGDNTPNSNAVTPGKVYGALGTYAVKLLAVEATNGCRDSVTQNITIAEKPVAGFTAAAGTNKGCVGTAISFDNGSFGPGGVTLTYAWSFGDGNNSSVQEPTHTYTSSGSKPVTLIVTAGGCRDTSLVNISINNAPVPTITSTLLNNRTMTYRFNATPANMAKYTWDFKDGGVRNTFVDSITNTYTSAGSYAVSVTVTDANGCTGSATLNPAIVIATVGINDVLANKFNLNVYPNPFNTDAQVSFSLNKASTVRVTVYDMLGRNVASINKGKLNAGNQTISLSEMGFNGAAGAYMMNIQIDDVVIHKQIIQQK